MGVRILFAGNDQWEICGEAQDGVEAIQKVMELSPDVVILDLTMPTLGGFETAKRIRRVSPSTKIIFFSIHETPTTARLVGADAFVSKSSAAGELARTITSVLAGGGINQSSMHYPDWTD
jgi:DNA-binding NarL/FixJ family response regulator